MLDKNLNLQKLDYFFLLKGALKRENRRNSYFNFIGALNNEK